jgi:O-antigen ligase
MDLRAARTTLSFIFSAWHNQAARIFNVDVVAVLLAITLPWSTTGAVVLIALLLVAIIPTLDAGSFLRSLARPVCALPLALLALAVVGTLWANSPWSERIHGINPLVKLIAIPFLLYHFERSQRGVWVFVGFFVSCALLMGFSWVEWFQPALKFRAAIANGIPVKNYIDQSQAFTLCMFALAPLIIVWCHQRRYAWAAACAALILGFFANMMFVISARTALLYMPAMLVLFAMRYLRRSEAALLLAGTLAIASLVWFTSPLMRGRIHDISLEYGEYQQNISGSTGQRLEYWQKSLKLFAEAPLLGNGTGSTRQLFEREAVGQSGLAAEVISNPHNQTLNVAVQWGLLGVVVLYAMWFCHLLMFLGRSLRRSLPAWIGLIVVAQNVVSSLLNSHLFDFQEGWIYVLGVGVAGGMVFGRQSDRATAGASEGSDAADVDVDRALRLAPEPHTFGP